MPQRADHAVGERLAADEAGVRSRLGLSGQMFARAKADFEFERPRAAEQDARIERAGFGHRDPRQQFLDQRRLSCAQRMAGSAAIKAAYRRGIIHRARPMAGRAALASPMSGLARLRGVRILRIVSATDILIGAAVPAMDAETGERKSTRLNSSH